MDSQREHYEREQQKAELFIYRLNQFEAKIRSEQSWLRRNSHAVAFVAVMVGLAAYVVGAL